MARLRLRFDRGKYGGRRTGQQAAQKERKGYSWATRSTCSVCPGLSGIFLFDGGFVPPLACIAGRARDGSIEYVCTVSTMVIDGPLVYLL